MADSNTMDVDLAKATPAMRKCFKCKKPGHFMAECLLWAVVIKAVIWEAIASEEAKVEKVPGEGFV